MIETWPKKVMQRLSRSLSRLKTMLFMITVTKMNSFAVKRDVKSLRKVSISD